MQSVLERIARWFPGDVASRQLARGSVVSLLIQGAGAGLIFFSEILLARVLGTGDYGLFATVMAWLQVLVMVALLGSNHLLVRFVPTYAATADWSSLRALVRHCSRISLALGIGIFVAAVLLLLGLGERVDVDTRWAFMIGMAALPVAALSLQRQAILRGLHCVAVALSPELIIRPLLLMLLLVCLAWGIGISVSAPAALALNGLAFVSAFLLGHHWQRRAMPNEARTSADVATRDQLRDRARGWLNIAVPLFLISGMQLLIVRMDIMLLGLLDGHEAAGRYAAASRVADLIVFALASANVIVAPLIAGLHARNDIVGLQRMLVVLAKGVVLMTVPLVAVVVLFGVPILGLFGGAYQSAYPALLILVCGQAVNAMSGPVDFVMSMTGQQVKMLQILALATGLNFALNVVLIPPFGLIGAAVATASTTVFWNLLMRRSVRLRLGVDASVLVLFRERGLGS